MSEDKITKSDMQKVFIRSFFIQGSWNFERMQALGFCFDMVPIIKRLYKDKESRSKALKRHLEYFNTQQFMMAPILGVTTAMEEKLAKGAEIDDGSINAVKIGLMGPFAGIGDPIFLGTLRPLLAALGAGLALSGSILGPILFFLSFNLVRLGFLWVSLQYGYEKGVDLIADVAGNALKKLTVGASVLGLFVMGALVSQWTSMNVPIIVSDIIDETGLQTITTVQDILDQILPGILPLGLTFLCMKLINKKISPVTLIFGLFAVGIIGNYFGILA